MIQSQGFYSSTTPEDDRSLSPQPTVLNDDEDSVMSLLRTPKMSGSSNGSTRKRCSMEQDTYNLERSLKRVRVSCCSPGELCLQRDLRNLVITQEWKRLGPDDFQCVADAAVLLTRNEAFPNDLRLHIRDCNVQVHLHFPRLYPHQAPAVSRIAYEQPCHNLQQQQRVQSILIRSELDKEEAPKTASTVVISNWTPVRRLGDVVVEVIRVIRYPQQFLSSATCPEVVSTFTTPLTASSSLSDDNLSTKDSDSIILPDPYLSDLSLPMYQEANDDCGGPILECHALQESRITLAPSILQVYYSSQF
jgi:hypothetical protein